MMTHLSLKPGRAKAIELGFELSQGHYDYYMMMGKHVNAIYVPASPPDTFAFSSIIGESGVSWDAG